MRRTTVLKSEIAKAQHAYNLAINARAAAVQAVSADPGNDVHHKALDAAAEAVRPLSDRLNHLNDALTEAERLDRIDEVASKRAGLIAARNRAVKLSASRKPIARELQANIDALSATLRKFEAANDETLLALHEATRGAAPTDPHAVGIFAQRVHGAANAVTNVLRNAFVIALNDAGLGEVGIDLDSLLEFTNPNLLAHGDRSGLEAAIVQSTTAIEKQIDFLHKSVGILPADPIEEVEPAIPPPGDEGDIVETVWGAPK